MGDSEIRADLVGIRDFGSNLRAEIDRELRPEGEHIASTFAWGVPFGLRSASHEVQDTANVYHQRLEQMTRLMATYIRSAEVMALAAETIAGAYQATDTSSGAGMQAIIGDASRRAELAFQQAESARIEAEKRAQEDEAEFMRSHGRTAR